MKRLLSPILFLFCFLFLHNVHAFTLSGQFPDLTDEELSDAFERAERIDSRSSRRQRSDIDDATRIEGGSQWDESCFQVAADKGYSREQAQEFLTNFMRDVTARTLRCGTEYPELMRFLREHISESRRQFFKCETENETRDYAAYSNGGGNSVLSRRTAERMFDAYGTRGFMADYNRDFISTVIFHEILHSTTANNRHDHNDIEGISTGYHLSSPTNFCGENASMDRVVVISSLCVGDHPLDANARLVLGRRMAQCGGDRGCRDLFTEEGNNITWLHTLFGAPPTRSLEDSQAQRICQRIQDDGMCVHLRREQGPTITRTRPQVGELRDSLQERLNVILPSYTNHVPEGVFEFNPDFQERAIALEDNSRCFRALFAEVDEGGYILKRYPGRYIPNRNDRFQSIGDLNMAAHLRGLRDDVHRALENTGACDGGEDEEEIRQLFTDISNSPVYNGFEWTMNMALKFAADDRKLDYISPGSLHREEGSNMQLFLGRNLHQRYFDVIDRFHYESPDFDCIAAGFSPFRATEQALSVASAQPPGPSCQ